MVGLVALLTLTATLQAQVAPEKLPAVAAKAFRHADLDIPAYNQEVRQLPAAAAEQARQRLRTAQRALADAMTDDDYVSALLEPPMLDAVRASLDDTTALVTFWSMGDATPKKELVACVLQPWPVSLPETWEELLRYHYIRGLHRGWRDRAQLL